MHSYQAFIHMNSFFMNLMNFMNSFIVQNAWERQYKMICIEFVLIRGQKFLNTG